MKKNNPEEEIDFVLDSYGDIFSSFDPRPFAERALSVDFIGECKRASADKTSPELILIIPKAKRNKKNEADIRLRLTEHFQKHNKEKEEEIKKIKREGFLWISLGVIIIITYVILNRFKEMIFNEVLFVFSWFFIWEGTAKIFMTAKEKLPDSEFYRKMSKAKIEFIDKK